MKHLLYILSIGLCFVGCKPPEARKPVWVKTGSFIKESAKRNKILNENERKQIEALIKNKPEKNFIASENGFWYHYNSKLDQDTITPQFGDHIQFSYNITYLDGSEIYSKEQLGFQANLIDKEELFTGLREGLKLMKPSEDVTFIFPSQIAYGYYGDEGKIGTNIPIICNVTLNTITQNNND
jgi:gliding motility-associated peptidyl-prolyl isomerase